MPRRRMQFVCAVTVFGMSACTPQLVPPYDETIDSGAQGLRGDFLKFVAERQRMMGTASGTYASQAAAYSDFLGRLGAIELRAADQPNGIDCAQVQGVFARVHTGLSSFDVTALGQAEAQAGSGGSCIAVLARIATQQITRLQTDDARRCAANPPGASCVDLFGHETVAAMVAAVHAPPANDLNLAAAAGSAPLVRAVLVSLDELAGAEQDLKAATGK